MRHLRSASLKTVWAIAGAVAAGVVLLDQLTKAWARSSLAEAPIELIPGVLRLVFTENTGAAFGLFRGAGTILALAAIVAVVFIAIAFRSVEHRMDVAALGLVMGGAIGNLVDRLTRGDGLLNGPVTDWIDPSFFATFNVADSAVTIGVALLLLGALRKP